MTSIVTRKFRIYNAQQFVESFNEISTANETLTQSPFPTESLNTINYIFIAKSTSWGTPDNPTEATDNIGDTEYQHWREMLSAARIQSSDISTVIKRYDWVSGTVYREYDDTSSTLFNVDYRVTTASLTNESLQPFYTVTSSGGDRRVYKCLYNNGGTPSIIEPTHTTTEPLRNTLTDGYIWKFIYDTASSKFETDNFIRVEEPESISVAGGIYNIKVSNRGDVNFLFLSNATEVVPGQLLNTTEVTIPLGNLTADLLRLAGSAFIDIDGGTRIFRTIQSAVSDGTSIKLILNSSIEIPIGTSHDFLISPIVNVIGDGTRPVQAVASPILGWASNSAIRTTNSEVRNSSIAEIDIANIDGATTLGDFGIGFTRATATISQGASASSIANTVIRPIISFPDGHGSSPIEEFGGNYVMVSKELAGAVVDTSNVPTFTVVNEFRKLGLLRDPVDSNNKRVTTTSVDQTFRIPISETTDNQINTIDFRSDDFTLTQSSTGITGNVINLGLLTYDSTNDQISLGTGNTENLNTLIRIGEIIFIEGQDTNTEFTVSSIATDGKTANVTESGTIQQSVDLTDVAGTLNRITGATGKIVDRFTFVDSSGVTRFRIRLTEVEGTFSNDLNASMQITDSSGSLIGSPITGSGSPIDGALQQFTGEMIYVEHRVPVRRSSDQTENVRLIIEF